jgi:homoserine kinase
MSGFVPGPVRVRIPATSANLGPGFDALGLAVALYDEAQAQVTDGGLTIDVHGEGGALVARDESHLVVRAMRRTFEVLAVAAPGLALECHNRIPHSRGLGSSAAAVVAGILLARALVADGAARLSTGDVLSLATELEGHPDNVAPCLLGGLTIAWMSSTARAVRRDLDPAIVPVFLIPPFSASTEVARGLLPETVSHADAAFAAGRSALLVAALTSTPQALFDATEDRLHQPYRRSAMPDTARLVDELRASGHAAVVSGAGPTVLVLARGDVEAAEILAACPQEWLGQVLPVDATGAEVLSGTELAAQTEGPL